MAHVAKYTKGACGNLWRHYERAKDAEGNYIKFSNQSIDPERTPLNYNLAPTHPEGQGGFVRRRCSEVKCLNRKDVNVMCSWVVTAPKTVPDEALKSFFMATYDFLSKRYGQDNVISAYVHMDEVTPHMHFAFVPVVESQNRKGEPILKVSAKEVITRSELQSFHFELEGHLKRVFGCELGIMNEMTKNGNKSVLELKKQDMLREGQKYKEIAEKCVLEGLEMERLLKTVQAKIEAKKDEYDEISTKVDVKYQELSKVDRELRDVKAEKKRLEKGIKLLDDVTEKADRLNKLMRERVGNIDQYVDQWLKYREEFDDFRQGEEYEEAYEQNHRRHSLSR